MRKIAIIGAGNVGVSAAKALFESCDMELCGFVRKNIKPVEGFEEIPVAESVFDLPKKPDGAIICVPSRFVDPIETELLINGIHTVDCFDIHEELLPLRKNLNAAAKMGNVSAIIGAGWDPGLDSVIRTLMVLPFSKGKTYTNFGPGMSMGHSAAAKSIDGIADAVSITIPLGNGRHSRKIYAVLKKNADKQAVEHAILSDGYFEHDECSVEFVESVKPFLNTAHKVKIERLFENQKAGFEMEIDNPSVTGRILAAAMRASFLQKPGAYFMPEIPPCDFCGTDCLEYL